MAWPPFPALLIMLLFFAGPIIWACYIAFTNKALTGVGASHAKWVGFSNFTHMFSTRCSSTLFCSPSFMSSGRP